MTQQPNEAVTEDCLKLSCYFGERHRAGGRFLADRLLDRFGEHGVAAGIMLRGVEGFGLKHHLRTDHSLTLSEDLPAVAIAVDVSERIEGLLADVARTPDIGLVTLERARLVRGDIGPVRLPEQLHEATKLTVYLGRQERVYRVPAYLAICDLMHRRGIAGASVLLGVDGTLHGRRERAHFFGRNADVPTMVMAVGSGDRIARVLPELGALLREPLITLERVRVCKRDGVLLDQPHGLPETDEHGLPIWQKLTVYTSEATRHDGRPIHRSITRRLRRTGARGVTSLRGIWGFHGDHPPHGDRPLQLGRHVPVVTIVIDSPDRIAAAFPVIDELTRERGLVTSEMVPALRARDGGAGSDALRLARHRF